MSELEAQLKKKMEEYYAPPTKTSTFLGRQEFVGTVSSVVKCHKKLKCGKYIYGAKVWLGDVGSIGPRIYFQSYSENVFLLGIGDRITVEGSIWPQSPKGIYILSTPRLLTQSIADEKRIGSYRVFRRVEKKPWYK